MINLISNSLVDGSHQFHQTEWVTRQFEKDMQVVDAIAANGIVKAWIYQHMVIPRISWSLFIHDLDVSFGVELNVIAVRHLKKWFGLSKSVDLGLLFRSRANFGLGLTSMDKLLKKL